MSWRWLIDNRGDRVEVDWPRLAVVLIAAIVVVRLVFWVLPPPWHYGILLIYAVAGIIIDIRLRRHDTNA